jgi:hypothetical protein
MAETIQSLADLGKASLRPAAAAPVHVQKLDKQGRAYATGKRKNAIARVWVKPGKGKITVNGKDFAALFRPSGAAMMLQQPIVAANRATSSTSSHRRRRRPLRPGRRRASRHLQGADLLRAGAARRAQEGRLPDPRQPRRRAQEVRQGQGPPQLPVLEALTSASVLTRCIGRGGFTQGFPLGHYGPCAPDGAYSPWICSAA